MKESISMLAIDSPACLDLLYNIVYQEISSSEVGRLVWPAHITRDSLVYLEASIKQLNTQHDSA